MSARRFNRRDGQVFAARPQHEITVRAQQAIAAAAGYPKHVQRLLARRKRSPAYSREALIEMTELHRRTEAPHPSKQLRVLQPDRDAFQPSHRRACDGAV